MKVRHRPAKYIPERNHVVFDEIEYRNMIRYDPSSKNEEGFTIYGDAHLSLEVEAWLNDQAPGWKVEFDRGDWGNGDAIVTISLPKKEQAEAFVKRFAKA